MPLDGASDPGSPVTKIDRAFRRLVDPVPHVGPIVASTLGPPVVVSTPDGSQSREVRPLVGDEAIAHVQRVAGEGDSGIWMPQLAAEALGVGPGDEIVVSEDQRDVTLTVDGVYRDIFREPGDGYWRPWNDEIVLYCEDCPPPPQPLIVDPPVFDELVSTLRLQRRRRVAGGGGAGPDLRRRRRGRPRTRCRRGYRRRCFVPPDGCSNAATGLLRPGQRPSFSSSMGDVLSQAQRRLATVESPAQLLGVAGLIVALVVVAAAGAFAMSARRVEASLLFARGTGPLTVGARAALEALFPCLVGAGLGLVAAGALVSAVGPDGRIASSATQTAVRATLLGAAVAVLTIAVVSAVSFLRHSELHRARLRFLTKVPWELALIGLAILVLSRLRSEGALLTDAASSTTRPSSLVLLFPVLFLAGFATLAARLAVTALRAGRRRSTNLPPAPFLAFRRLVDAPQLTLLVGAAVCASACSSRRRRWPTRCAPRWTPRRACTSVRTFRRGSTTATSHHRRTSARRTRASPASTRREPSTPAPRSTCSPSTPRR
jgi:putative ABC transport system permease protein